MPRRRGPALGCRDGGRQPGHHPRRGLVERAARGRRSLGVEPLAPGAGRRRTAGRRVRLLAAGDLAVAAAAAPVDAGGVRVAGPGDRRDVGGGVDGGAARGGGSRAPGVVTR
ncbi:hypothetical protein FHN55_15710 [Streptomyces sp. NP160]|nr:hypothetical protein FHN55_15710 [Streptomyces sp. NP160]